MNYEIQPVTIQQVRDLCTAHHGYGGAGGTATYAFGVFEGGRIVAAYAWQPPAPGAAKSVCPEAPHGVLALSRMVAVPRAERLLNHVSKPLRHQMRHLIDRTRWPVLVTYSDEGQGHTGHVYKCSGWQRTGTNRVPFFTDGGRRVSSYSNGKSGGRDLIRGGVTVITRWEHRVCPQGHAWLWMMVNGWCRVTVPGKTWKSGNQAHTYKRILDPS